MKKVCSIVLLLAMLLSLAVVGTFGTSAANARIAPYAATAPTVDADCTKDAVYDQATEYAIGTRGNVQVLWNESGLYFYFRVKAGMFLDVYISGKSFVAATADTAWGTAGDYYFKVMPNGTLADTDFSSVFGAKRVPENMQIFTHVYGDTGTDNSGNTLYPYYVEIFIPMTANDWSVKDDGTGEIAFGAMVDNNWQVSGFTSDGTPTLNALQKMTLAAPTEAIARSAAFARTGPAVDADCTKDEVYNLATPIAIGGRGNIWTVWNTDGLYIYGELIINTQITFIISGKGDAATWADDTSKVLFSLNVDGSIGNPTYASIVGEKTVPEGFVAYFKTVDGSTRRIEIFIPMAENDWYLTSDGSASIRLGALIDSSWNYTGFVWDATTGSKTPGDPTQVYKLKLECPAILRGVQTTAVANGTFDARFVAEIASLNYDKAGFEVSFTYNGKVYTQKLDTTVAYSSILADGQTLAPTTGKYFIAVVLKDIPADAALCMSVKPYTVVNEHTTYGDRAVSAVTPVLQSN